MKRFFGTQSIPLRRLMLLLAAFAVAVQSCGHWGGAPTIIKAPVGVGGLVFASLTGSSAFKCGLTTGGAAYCWGNSTYGQVGDGTTIDRSVPTRVISP
jgi:hypothetical protein